jgi:cytochrome c oxidase accessory protein FixG
MTEDTKPQGNSKESYFRDRLSTVNADGKRVWVFPKKPKGKLTNYRKLVSYLILAFFFLAPFLKVEGEQFLLLNILERKFILFGVIFWPQDFHLIVLSLITFIVFIIVFTVIYGRIFCGWICPQTLLMESVYRQIEYLVEGDFNKQKRLAKQVWNFEKIWKKGLKHFIFLGVSYAVGNTVLAYIIGMDPLLELIQIGPDASFNVFLATIVFSGAVYFVFAFFREQVCTIVCPYGRLQGVLLDNKSIIVAYDYNRGEPRSLYKPLEQRGETDKGDCIDCKSCVLVCPTNVDIRNGTQMECINCTACIDACNVVMVKHNQAKGLIRFDSEKGIQEGNRSVFSARSIAYTIVLAILLSVVANLFTMRGDVETTILRQRGSLFQKYGEESYSNVYQFEVVNKTRLEMPIEIQLLEPEFAKLQVMGGDIVVEGEEIKNGNFLVIIEKEKLTSSNTPLKFGIYSKGELIDYYEVTFVGPNALDQ